MHSKVSREYPGNCRMAKLTIPGKMVESVMRTEFPDSIHKQGLLGKRGKGSPGSLMCQSLGEVSTACG